MPNIQTRSSKASSVLSQSVCTPRALVIPPPSLPSLPLVAIFMWDKMCFKVPLFLDYVYGCFACLPEYMCIMYVPGAVEGPRGHQNSLELGCQRVVSCHVCSGSKTLVLCKSCQHSSEPSHFYKPQNVF